MKKLFLLLTAFFIFLSCSDESQESKNVTPSISDSFTLAAKKGRWCRVFTVEISVGFASISTDVTICIASIGGYSPIMTIKKDGSANMTGYIKTNELIEKSPGNISLQDIESIIFTKTNPEEIEGKKWQIKSRENKIVTFDNETYLEVILEETK